MLLVLSSLYGATGGIPAFNRLLLRAAGDHAEARRLTVQVIALTDPQPPPEPPPAGLTYRACAGDRRRCVLAFLEALPAHRSIVLGHVNLAPLGVLARLAGRPFGVIAHGADVWPPLAWYRRLALRQAQAVGCVSQDTAHHVEQVQGVAASRLVRLVNAIDPLPDAPADEPLPPAGRPLHIVSVTRLHPGEPKGIELVLGALTRPPLTEATYTVIGDGAARTALQAQADRLGLGGRARFVGGVSDAERDGALRGCDVFALPSSNEGFGIVYLEAMAQKKPCLAARVGGAPEVVLDGETGLVVEPTVDAVHRALVRLGDPSLRQRLGAAGRERVASCFTYPAFRRHAETFFIRLADPSRRTDG